MKKLILGMALSLVSVSAFADLSECAKVQGSFTCDYNGSPMELNLKQAANSLTVEIAGGTQTVIADGAAHQYGKDISQVTAVCAANKIEIKSEYKESVGTVTIAASEKGVNYSLNKNGQGLTLTCVKK